MNLPLHSSFRAVLLLVLFSLALCAGCSAARGTGGLSADEITALNSLQQLDDYPLYTMTISGDTRQPAVTSRERPAWGCALFAALADPGQALYGRNFDWQNSPALLLFTYPKDGYASVSMVDLEYLGFEGRQAKELTSLPLDQRAALLGAVQLPFDGMNEKGLAVGMAAVPDGQMRPDPAKKTIGELGIMREILDHAATVDEAVQLIGQYNINMEEVPVHYLIASIDGSSALVEFRQGQMHVLRSEQPWHAATNFLVSSTGGSPAGQCSRYDAITATLAESGGSLDTPQALALLKEVSQPTRAGSPTQWSVVYNLSDGSVTVVIGRKFSSGGQTLRLRPAPR